MTTKIRQKKIVGSVALALIAIVAVFGYASMSASAASSVVQDAKGDAKSATESATNVDSSTPADTARGYLDITSVKVTKKNGTGEYVFSMTLAAPVPKNLSDETCYTLTGTPGSTSTFLSNPPNPDTCFFAWNWNVNDSSVLVGSNPIAPTVRWKNNQFEGVSFRDNGPPITFTDFSVKGAKITATIDAEVIEEAVDVSDGFFYLGATRNHRIDFSGPTDPPGDPLVGVADFTDFGNWSD